MHSLRGRRSKGKGEGEFEREARSWGWVVGGELGGFALRARTPLLPSPSNAGHAGYEMHEDELLKNRQSACMASASPQPCIKNASSLQIPSSISDTIELTSMGYYRLSISSCFTSGFVASLLLFFMVIYR